MKALKPLGLILILFTLLFATTTMAQTNYVWNRTSGDWGTAANWTPIGVPGTNAGDTATISNGGTPTLSAEITVARVTITNSATFPAGSTLTIDAIGKLNVSSSSINNVILSGGNIINNGELNITTINAAGAANVPIGISCTTPTQLPSVATDYGYSGNGVLKINIAGYITTAGTGAAINISATNTNTSYKFIFGGASNIENSMTLNTTVVSYAFRASGGVNASPLIIGGTGFTLGSGFGGLFSLGGRSIVTINTGTTVNMNSNAENTTTGISAYSGANIPVSFNNKGTVNMLGTSKRSGISVSVENTGKSNFAPNLNFMNFENQGVLNIDMACSAANQAPLVVTASGTGQGNFNMLNTSTGLMTLKNTNSTGSNIGSAIFVTAGGNIANVNFTNNGTLNLSGTNAVVGGQSGTAALPRSQFINTGTITSNSNFNLWTVSNSSTGTIIFTTPTSVATTLPFNGAFAVNNGKIQTATGSTSLTNLRGITAYSSTSSIEPGGNGYGIADLGIIGITPPAGTLKLQVDGNTAGTDYDQLSITTGGAGYTSAPTITFTGGAGSGASGYVTVSGETITAVTIVSGGSGYTDGTTVSASVGSGATLTATVSGGAVTGVSVVAGGTGFTANSNLTFTNTVTTAATASTTIASGAVNAINLLSGGAGYTTAPTVSFSTSGSTSSAAVTTSVSGGAVTGFNTVLSLSSLNLEITSLYTPTSSVSIPIVTTSEIGTISGNFASVTGLAPGWTLSYASPTSVNLVYTFVVIPTIWTGVANNDFFNEANWRDSVTNLAPVANSINPGSNINLHLQINSAAANITGGAIQFGTGSLAVGSGILEATSLSGGTVTLNENGYINLSSSTPFLNNVQINLTSGIGWIRTPNLNASAISASNLGQIKVNGSSSVYATNLRLDHYYLNGSVIRANLATTAPLTIYDNANGLGTSAAINVNTIHSGDAIANGMNNKMESFVLKKGFMVTIAIENDGTGKSKNFIASESDLVINVLPQTLQNAISFIRVMPWNWVTKKGFNAPVDSNLNASWRYQWNPNDPTTLAWEFAPMTWGHTSANDPADIALLIEKYNSPYVMSFNEPDHCEGQSGQYGNLCQTDVAVGYHKNLMKTGMRIVSPGGREEAPFTWLKEFHDKTTAQDIRVDVIAVHWYDWGSAPDKNPNPTALEVFNRFKAYLTNVHNLYGLPIWITEFNANPARSQAINAGFLELALPYLESLDYIERYCWFPFNTGTHFTTGWDEVNRMPTNEILSLVGTIYKNINNTTPVHSTPAIPEATMNSDNNLNLSDNPNVALNKPAIASSVWNTVNVASNAVDGDTTSTESRWLVDFQANVLPAWLEVDLQGSFTIDSFRIFEGSNAVRNFQFQIWNPALNSNLGGWSTALTVTDNASSPLTTYRTIAPVATTRVRLLITAHNDLRYIRMFELEVYGLKNSPTWTGGTSTTWTTATNWSTGIVPDQFSDVLIAGGATYQPIILTTTTINSLAIASGATLTVTAPNFTVKGAIDNDGVMSIADNSNLLQGEKFNPNTGNVRINKSSSALNRLDYTIWSSPVESQNLAAFSPATSLNRFYNYNQTTNFYTAVTNPSTTVFGLAAGNLIRMPNTHPTIPTVWSGTFTGVPNNGTITRVVTYKNEDPFNFGYNMIGNPYPSTISANAFINQNTTRIESTLYFWRKTNGALGSAYATWINGIGGTASGAGSPVPNGTIQVGQGFFVKAKPGSNSALLTYNQTLTFNNEMRLGNTSTQFFKTTPEEKHRLWLNLTTTTGVFSQTLIGYLNGGTNGLDDFDGKYINDSPIALTSNINNDEYTIQGRSTFDPSDVVALNFKTDLAGDYTIALDHFDGVFETDQEVYLVDKNTGLETDLKLNSYTFDAPAGIDNARFSLKYQKTLKVDAPTLNENTVRVYKKNGILYVNSGSIAMDNVQVFDIQGRLITQQRNVKSSTTSLKNLKSTSEVLIVKITGEDNSVVAKKVLN